MNPIQQPPSDEAVKAAFDLVADDTCVEKIAALLRVTKGDDTECIHGSAARVLAAHARAREALLKECLNAIPMVNMQLHTIENLPSLIAGTVLEHVESWNENERLREALGRIKDHDCDLDAWSVVADMVAIADKALTGEAGAS